jgi:site-specific DNA-methyltransferase (adenine-specific)/site-specific DNA-methyltransferase (cytosine-N4-specific)
MKLPLSSEFLGSSQIIVGDTTAKLRAIPSAFFQCCITSPPYWGTRDYGIEGQIGAEQKVGEYIEHLRGIFAEVGRVLKDDGTLWLNIGDTYTSGNRTWRGPDRKNPSRAMTYRPPTPDGLKPKDLIGIPWRLAFALQDDGWYLRSDIIWHKPNAQPESVRDRPTRAHEYVFLLSKSERYYYDYRSLIEPTDDLKSYRNRRTIWRIPTNGNGYGHLAVFPEELVRQCMFAGSRPGDYVLDPFLGSGTVGVVARDHGREFVGIELKDDYVSMARRRIGDWSIRQCQLVSQ